MTPTKRSKGHKPAAPKKGADSLLQKRLRSLYAWVEDQRVEGVTGAGDLPANGEELAVWMSSNPAGEAGKVHAGVPGVSITPNAVRGWRRGEWGPTGRKVALLEALFGVPWGFLMDPANEWPVRDPELRAALAAFARHDWRRVGRALLALDRSGR